MCGITGFLDPRREYDFDEGLRLAKTMADTLAHRGPDDHGVWGDINSGAYLGHRRLSVLDLTADGHQPMESHCGRYVIVFNGEVYNHLAVRAELESNGSAPHWRGHSDTEVALAAFSTWGIQESVERFVGMFALALWDKLERKLYLVRDRMGEKPLYYGWQSGFFVFGSELKAVEGHPGIELRLNSGSVGLFLKYNCIPSPHTVYRGLHKVPPGCIVTVEPGTEEVQVVEYWSMRRDLEKAGSEPFEGDEEDATDELRRLLREAIELQMHADVPVGAFLSGGIDSSLVVAVYQEISSRPIKTFSIGFDNARFNEAHHASKIASHLGTDHTELYVTADDALQIVQELPNLYDEPFSDPSLIPTVIVARLARTRVTVSLSGDGGDELFYGYDRYESLLRRWHRRLSNPLSPALGVALGMIPEWLFDAARSVTSFERIRYPGPISRSMRARRLEDFYHHAFYNRGDPARVMREWVPPLTVFDDHEINGADERRRLGYLDSVSYLPDDILVKVDRAAMSASLESRIPFLDHRVVEYSSRLPTRFLQRGCQSKWILKKLLSQYVPVSLFDRPKMGFGVPTGEWLRGPLRDWAEALLAPSRLKEHGLFKEGMVQAKWRHHIKRKINYAPLLWNVLVFQSWYEAHV